MKDPLVTVKGLISVLKEVEKAIRYNNPEILAEEIYLLEEIYEQTKSLTSDD